MLATVTFCKALFGESKAMFESLINVEKRYNELSELMADQQIASDYEQMARLAKERSDLQEMVETFRRYQTIQRELRSFQHCSCMMLTRTRSCRRWRARK